MPEAAAGRLYMLGVHVEKFMYVDVADLVFPTSGVTQFTGPNGNGKTDALTAIEATLLGGAAIPKTPVQTGSERAETEIPIGGADGKPEFIAKRVYRDGGTTSLEVRGADGTKRASPQALLDAVCDARFLNPVKFANPGRGTEKANNEYRLEVLFGLCPLSIDLPAHDAAVKLLDAELTPVNRRIKDLGAVVRDATASAAPDGPEEDETALVGEVAKIENSVELRSRAAKRVAELDKEIADVEAEIKRLQAKAKLLADEWTKQGQLSQAAAGDPAPAKAKLDAVRARNAARRGAVADRARAEERAGQLQRENARAAEIKSQLERMAETREAALRAAKFPLKNLTVSSDGWLSVRKPDGAVVPFHQENTAKRILSGFVLFAATNPKLRAFVIREGGNDLDDSSMMLLAQMSAKFDIPVFIERLIGNKEAGAVIEFRSGNVVGATPAGGSA